MIVLLTSTGGGLARIGQGVAEFALQMAVGGAVGWLAPGAALVDAASPAAQRGTVSTADVGVRRCPLYGAATVAHVSGFLAVFVAGIVVGDANAPYKRTIERFHSALASLAEIVAFVVLGLAITLRALPAIDAILPGFLLAAGLTLVIRPLLVGLVMLPLRLAAGERVFLLWSGLKGAVPGHRSLAPPSSKARDVCRLRHRAGSAGSRRKGSR